MDELRLILIIAGLIFLVAIYWMGRRDERRAQEKKESQYSQQPQPQTAASKESWLEDDDAFSPSDQHADYDSFYLGEDDKDIFYKPVMKKSNVVRAEVKSGYTIGSKSVSPAKSETVMVTATEPEPQRIELPAGVEPLLINLTIMASKDMTFDPYFLKQTLDGSGLVHGDMNIYHYFRKPKLEFEANRGQRLFSVASMVEPGYFDPEDMSTYRTPGIALFLQLPGPIDGVLAFEKMHQVAVMIAKQLSGILCDDKRNKITLQTITHLKDQISEYNLKLRTKLGRTVH